MSRRPRIYIAGPIDGSGDRMTNLRNALEAADKIMELGGVPFIPHLNTVWQMVTDPKRLVSEWQAWNDEWLSQCNALYRLAGRSPGSDYECSLARELGLVVFEEPAYACSADALEDLKAWIQAPK